MRTLSLALVTITCTIGSIIGDMGHMSYHDAHQWGATAGIMTIVTIVSAFTGR